MTRILGISFFAFAVAATSLVAPTLAAPAPAAAPAAAPAPVPAVKPLVLNGSVVALDGLKLTVKDAAGASTTVSLTPDTLLIKVTKIELGAIKPGSFVATANVNQADGTGVSSELRIFAPPLNGLGEGSYPMQDGQNMTNGTVNVVTASPKGHEMDVGYSPKCTTNVDDAKCKAGVRHITVPDDMIIHQWEKIAPADLKPGVAVSARGRVTGDAAPVIRVVFIGESGQPPAV